jgi:hypothetical protein
MSVPRNETRTILEIIDRRLIPDEQAKRARGEVFTPLDLVREMLHGLRKADLEAGTYALWGYDLNGNVQEDSADNRIGGIPLEMWRDPDTKWLDPANGIGNFPFVVFHTLDFQLKNHGTKGSKQWTDEKRRKHIVQKMLYMIELDRGNVNTTFKVMDFLVPGVKPNLCCADTLSLKDQDFQRHFGTSKFHVIMGNPPFQADPDRPNADDSERKTKAPRKGGQGKLYERFTMRMLELLEPQGYLAFVTPDNIFSGIGLKSYQQIIKKQVVLLNLANIQGRYFKGIGQSICYFVVSQKDADSPTRIVSATDTFLTRLKNRAVNPVREWTKETDTLLETYISDTKNGFKYNRGTTATDYSVGKYEVVYTPTSILRTDDVSLAPGHGIPFKVILFETKPKAPAFYDKEGKYGVGPHTFYYAAKSDAEATKLVAFTNSADYKKLLSIILTSQYLKSSFVQYLNIDAIAK